MKDKLYYTPELEEFHPGFEYEMCLRNKEGATFWQRRTVGPQGWQGIWNIPFSINKGYRVKHLDKEDIESLGFIHVNGKVYNLPKTNISLWYNFSNVISSNSVTIREIQGDMFFDVAIVPIKNKSELKRLLKQLEI